MSDTDPQPQPPTWESAQRSEAPAPDGAPGFAQPSYQQPPYAASYPPPPLYAPGPGYGLQPMAPIYAGDTSTASMAHWLPILVGFWGPLIIMATAGTRDPYVRENAVESLNFSLTLMIVYLVAAVVGVFCFVAWIALAVVPIGALVVHIMAAVATSRGEQYRYPVNIRMVH